jgi:hypothetical protein
VAFLTFPPGYLWFFSLDKNPVFASENPSTGVATLELGYARSMPADLESTLLAVWQQTLIDKKKTVELGGETYPVRQTAKSKLKQVDFRFEDRELRGLEQNPITKSRWAKMAREGKRVMQFLERGKYIAVVVDGKVHVYR